MCLVFRKSACPSRQVKTKMYLPERPFFKYSLAGASGLVLMSVPHVKNWASSHVQTVVRDLQLLVAYPVIDICDLYIIK